MNFKWTKDKVELLKIYYSTSTWDELYKILGTTKKQTIMSMASKCKISRDIYNNCHAKNSDIEYIRENNDKMMAHEMATNLGKSVTFVCRIISRLGMKPKSRIRVLRDEDVELFKELYPKYTNKYLHEKYFPYLDRGQLRTQARRFSLVKNSDKTIKWYDKEQLLDDLKQAIIKLGRFPALREFKELGLPSETTFRRYFGGINKVCELMGAERPNYNIIACSPHKDKNNNLCFSLPELHISNFLIDHKYHFEKEVCYNKVIPGKECGKRRFDWFINNCAIEYFGLMHLKEYAKEALFKIELCKKNNIPLLELYPQDFSGDKWKDKISIFLEKNKIRRDYTSSI